MRVAVDHRYPDIIVVFMLQVPTQQRSVAITPLAEQEL